jgi:hypothetical protein
MPVVGYGIVGYGYGIVGYGYGILRSKVGLLICESRHCMTVISESRHGMTSQLRVAKNLLKPTVTCCSASMRMRV